LELVQENYVGICTDIASYHAEDEDWILGALEQKQIAQFRTFCPNPDAFACQWATKVRTNCGAGFVSVWIGTNLVRMSANPEHLSVGVQTELLNNKFDFPSLFIYITI
jgi:hypothetical protein